MTRLERRNRTDIIYKSSGGILDAFDNAIKEAWRINDDEYDFISSLDERYLDALIYSPKVKTVSSAKEAVRLINEALEIYNNTEDVSR